MPLAITAASFLLAWLTGRHNLSRAEIVPLRGGMAEAGRWIDEERNVFSGYQKFFGGNQPSIHALARTTDTDGAGGKAVAYFTDFSSCPPR